MERKGNAATANVGNAERWEASANGVIVLPAGSAAPARQQPSPPQHRLHHHHSNREKLQGMQVTGGLGDFVISEPPERVHYKTKLCEKFMSGGRCMYLENCTFAHGHAELRPPVPLPSGAWRSRLIVPHMDADGGSGGGKVHYHNTGKVCFAFRDTGRCSRGANCNFTHSQTVVQPGAEIRYKPSELSRRSATTPPVCVFTVGGNGFAPPGPGADGQGERKLNRLELMSLKKTSGIYGDWPEGY
ncbi:hypothetical protein EJB05_05485, partial [Eragrostis curvula]